MHTTLGRPDGPHRLLEARVSGIVEDVLNFALTLEHLEAEFYTHGVGANDLLTGSAHDVFDQIRKHEVAHVADLQALLGDRAAPKPEFDFTAGGKFPDAFTNAHTFMALAQAFEDTGVRAYKGQAANLMGHGDVLEAALKIHSVEARHASQVRRMRQQKGWITENSRGDLPSFFQPVYDGEANHFQILTATLGGGVGRDPAGSASFDETLTKGQVWAIVRPFMRGGVV